MFRRVYLSIAAAAIYMASQASELKKTQKGWKQNRGRVVLGRVGLGEGGWRLGRESKRMTRMKERDFCL